MNKKTISTRGSIALAEWVQKTFGNRNRGMEAMIWFIKAILDKTELSFSDEVLKEIAQRVGNLPAEFWADIEVIAIMVGGTNGILIKTLDVNECFAMMVRIQKLKVNSEK
jgi:GGDEF domain-containing protein